MTDPYDVLFQATDPALVIVTVTDGVERDGCLVGFHGQCSIEPLRYLLWLSKANRTYRVARRSDVLAVHVLSDRDEPLARRFGGLTGDEVDKFAGIDVLDGPQGVPLLVDCPHRMVVRRMAILDDF